MTSTDIWRDFDPNLEIPVELKNVRVVPHPENTEDLPDPDAEIDIQTETLSDEESELDDGPADDEELQVPGSFEIVSQTVRTAPDGRQVVDIILEVEEVEGAVKYEVRVTKA